MSSLAVTAGPRPLGPLREPVSGLTHLAGALLAVAGLVALLVARAETPVQVVAFALYGSSLIALYAASSAYHLLRLSPEGTARLRKVDHISIFLLIAGSYVPVCLVALGGAWGWSIFGVVMGLAVAGLFVSLFWIDAPRWITTGIYLLMGWVGVIAIYPMALRMPTAGIVWLFVGGVTYSGGAVIYARKRPNPLPGVFGFHEIWHLFVLGGSAAHYVMMWNLS